MVDENKPARRHPISFRTTSKLKLAIESAAAASGRSMAQEVEYRLQRSFDREAMAEELLALAKAVRDA